MPTLWLTVDSGRVVPFVSSCGKTVRAIAFVVGGERVFKRFAETVHDAESMRTSEGTVFWSTIDNGGALFNADPVSLQRRGSQSWGDAAEAERLLASPSDDVAIAMVWGSESGTGLVALIVVTRDSKTDLPEFPSARLVDSDDGLIRKLDSKRVVKIGCDPLANA